MAEFDLTDGTNSRIESSLTGAEGKFSAPVSRLERIINGEDIKPLSRIEEVMTDYVKNGGGSVEALGANESFPNTFNQYARDFMLEGQIADDIVYDPYAWLYRPQNATAIDSHVDSNGKWHVFALGTPNAQCATHGIYSRAIDPKKVKKINFEIDVDGGFYPNDNGNKTTFGLFSYNRLGDFQTNRLSWINSAIAYEEFERIYDDHGTKRYVEHYYGAFTLDPNSPLVYWGYWAYALDLIFNVNYTLRED